VDGLSGVQFNASIGNVGLSATSSEQQRRHPALDAAAKLLDMSASDLRSAMQSGQSLASIASSKGISQDTLTAAMASAIEEANPTISADQANKVATSIATLTPPTDDVDSAQGTSGTQAAGGHHHRHNAGAAAMDAAASTLGMSATDLASSLQSGQSLATIAKSKGVSLDDVVKAMATALQGADSNLSSEQATAIATQMANRTPGSQDGQWSNTSGSVTGASTYSVTA